MAPLPKICHTSYKDETWHNYTLPKEDLKNIWITWHTSSVLLTSACFYRKTATKNWRHRIEFFGHRVYFKATAFYRSNELVKQATCFYFPEMSWLLAEHKGRVLRVDGRGPYDRTAGRVLAKSNNLVFYSFDMVPKYIYSESGRRKHCLNPMRLAICLAMGSDRIIAKQGNSLLGLPLNRYVMTQVIYVYHFHQNQYFILRHFWWGNL